MFSRSNRSLLDCASGPSALRIRLSALWGWPSPKSEATSRSVAVERAEEGRKLANRLFVLYKFSKGIIEAPFHEFIPITVNIKSGIGMPHGTIPNSASLKFTCVHIRDK